MSFSLIPSDIKLIAAGAFALVLGSMLVGGAVVIEKHGEATATARLQPKIDSLTASVGELTAVNATNQATIHAYQLNERAVEAINTQLQARLDAVDQQAADVNSTIRKLQNDNQDVRSFLGTPIPAALRSVLNDPTGGPVPASASGADQGRQAAAAGGNPVRAQPAH